MNSSFGSEGGKEGGQTKRKGRGVVEVSVLFLRNRSVNLYLVSVMRSH